MSVFSDRVRDTTSTVGTGTVTLAGAPPVGFEAFSVAFAVGDYVYYTIESGAEWEVGRGQLVTSTTLSRLTVLNSSNADALVNFSAGVKIVFCTAPAHSLERANAFNESSFRRYPFFSNDFLTSSSAFFLINLIL